MSHDTDKLIRQLSLVAFLMAERRPLTARDIKSNVEGYQEMSDEAFARRFYSDRAELVGARRPARLAARRVHGRGALHAPLRALLPAAARARGRRARGAADVPLPAGGPVRLRRAAAARAPEPRARPPSGCSTRRRRRPRCSVEVRDPDYTPELQGRLGKLEGAISKQRTIASRTGRSAATSERERTVNPYALLPENGTWYVIGDDQEDKVVKSFRVSRIRSDIRFASRRERDFRMPEDFDIEQYRGRADVAVRRRRRRGADRGRAGHRLVARRACTTAPRNRVEGDVFVTEYASLPLLARWILRQDGRAVPLAPAGAAPARGRGRARRARRRTRARRRSRRAEAPRVDAEAPSERPAGPVAPERFGVLQSLLAYLLAACGDEREAVIPAPSSSSGSRSRTRRSRSTSRC